MKSSCHFKDFLDFQKQVSREYNKQALNHQFQNNSDPNKPKIWRHGFIERIIRFVCDGKVCELPIEFVRFIEVETRRTFMFYGAVFLSCIRYSMDFVKQALSDPASIASLSIQDETLQRWKKRFAGILKHSNADNGYSGNTCST